MSLKDKEKWDNKYATGEYVAGREPCEWLKENAGLLTGRGKALDLAMGEGQNAVFAAGRGYDVTGVDISEAGIRKALALAKEQNVRITAVAADIDAYRIRENEYDLILCFYFLDRRLFPEIRNALKPGGLLFYETFTADHLKHGAFKREWTLEPNELLKAFGDLRVLKYQEVDQGEKACASLIAQKPGNPKSE